MDEYRENVKIVQEAVEQKCAGLQPDPGLAQRVLQAADRNGGFKVKKASVGLAIAIVTMLLAVTAVAAALLTPKEVVEETALPLALKNDTENFTREELLTILTVAEENGITLSEYWYSALEAPQGAPKDELIRSLAAEEFGSFMYWTIEQQHWFGEILVAIGAWEVNTYVLPSKGELDYCGAYDRVREYILVEHQADVADASRWTTAVEYSFDVNDDGSHTTPCWWFCFVPGSLADGSYEVCMSPQGEIYSCRVQKYDSMQTTADVNDAYSAVYGSVDRWSPEVWASFGVDLAKAAAGQPPRELKRGGAFMQACHLGARYIVPPKGCIPIEKACRIALESVGLDFSEVFVAFCCMDGETPIWKVVTHTLGPEDMNSGRFTATWMVELDCVTGEVCNMTEWTYADQAGIMYAPRSVYEPLLDQLP